MDMEKGLVPKILFYSKFKINLINYIRNVIERSILNHKNRENDWCFIPHLPIIREIRVQILEDKFYNAILISTREKIHRVSMKLFFLFHFDRVKLIKSEREKNDTVSIISQSYTTWSYTFALIIYDHTLALFPPRVLLATVLPWKTRMDSKNTL